MKCGRTLLISYRYDEVEGHIWRKKPSDKQPGIWIYEDLLPAVAGGRIVSLGEGNTHMHKCERLGEELGLRNLFVKDETTNPTGSFLDRGSTVLVTWAKDLGFLALSAVASGNFGASLSAYTAKAGIKCELYLQGQIDPSKLYQIVAYGASVKSADIHKHDRSSKNKDAVFSAKQTNPVFLEGLKTTGFEIIQQMTSPPNRIVVPMGSGSHIAMIWKAVVELRKIGWEIGGMPMMTGTQLSGSAPIVDAWLSGSTSALQASKRARYASEIAGIAPSLSFLASEAITESDGVALAVTYGEILEGTRLLAKEEGIFAEPAAASTISGVKRLVEDGEIDSDESVVCVITGAGLKDPVASKRVVERGWSVQTAAGYVDDERLLLGLGATKMTVLRFLARGDSYGYEIWKYLREERSASFSIPSVYQHLGELVDLGLIEKGASVSVRGKRSRAYYTLTERGRAFVGRSVLLES